MNPAMQLGEGFIVMVIGMSAVFIFLSLLVVSLNVMGRVVAKLNELYPEPEEETTQATPRPNASAAHEAEQIAVALAVLAARR